jgi:superfamily I DNA/RNA helicase
MPQSPDARRRAVRQMTPIANREQTIARQAIEVADQSPLVTIEGRAGSGKTHTLVARAIRIASTLREHQRVLVSAPSADSLASLRSAFNDFPNEQCSFSLLGDVAFDILRTHAQNNETGTEPTLLDDVRAARLFERAAGDLLSLEWADIVSAEIDPEIAGMRTPERFLAAAYRLIRKLRAAQIEPKAFEALCERGTTAFYAEPPNFTHPDLRAYTSANYRDSLHVDRDELMRQRDREKDLAKIMVRLYARYREFLASQTCYTIFDALSQAAKHLLSSEPDRTALQERYPYACIDDAQDLTACEIAFLQAFYGRELHGVTFAGDGTQATRTFAGARGEKAFTSATLRFTLREDYRCPQAVTNVARRGIDTRFHGLPAAEDVTLYRATTIEDEARYVAENAAALIAQGAHPAQLALITRSIRGVGPYIAALLERNVDIDIGGDANLHDFAVVHDALAVLWSAADPYRHDYLLRALETPWVALSDASIALLCGEPSNPQEPLFEMPQSEGETGRSRWDRRRDLRLGRNVTQGDRDIDLPSQARERLAAFRAARLRWESLERTLDLPDLVRAILGETLLANEPHDARTRFEAGLLARLIEEIDVFSVREPLSSLRDFLEYRERVAAADEELLFLPQRNLQAMSLLSVEAAKGRSFDHVFLVDARASGFPRYYAPDAFVFYPSLGMTAKENVGQGTRAARTAKFTYALHAFKTRERYIEEERRAFAYAASRARKSLRVSASGRPTRGTAAPEFLEELRAAHIPGVTEQLRAKTGRLP